MAHGINIGIGMNRTEVKPSVIEKRRKTPKTKA